MMKTTPLLTAGLIAATGTSGAFAGTVFIRANGVVASNSLSVGPFIGQPSNSTVVMTFDVTTPGIPWPHAPLDAFEYQIDTSSFEVNVNGAVLGQVNPTQTLIFFEGFPVVDALNVNATGLDAGLVMSFGVSFTGATFTSLDITQAIGFYDLATTTSYSWLITGSGVGSMSIDFTSVEILATGLGMEFCLGDGTGLTCACGNTGGIGEGCANSTNAGGVLTAQGSISASADDVEFLVAGLPVSSSALLFSGNASLGTGALFGDGLRCVGGQLTRLGVLTTDASGAATWPTGLGTAGGWVANDTRWFQVWYRDLASPCSNDFNTSSGLEITFGN